MIWTVALLVAMQGHSGDGRFVANTFSEEGWRLPYLCTSTGADWVCTNDPQDVKPVQQTKYDYSKEDQPCIWFIAHKCIDAVGDTGKKYHACMKREFEKRDGCGAKSVKWVSIYLTHKLNESYNS